MNHALEILIEHRQNLVILKLGGFFGQLEVYRLKNRMESLIEEGYKFAVLDLGNVSYLDSAGIGSIVQIRKGCLVAGGNLYLVDATSPQVRQAMATAAIPVLIPTYTSRDDACRAIARQYGLVLDTPGDVSDRATNISESGSADLAQIETLINRLMERSDKLERQMARLEQRLNEQSASALEIRS